ncbi:beta-ketoacyl-[acyl-carrier-protein] synthase family protein [Streptomyces ossamyceticus]|uniref:beta-ketoacyl-[acyl-carrier-protein] synthase family protein n=1 Tax=Streptomyces TaxID=1883 RepID=UPI0006E241B8|nr:beta-ketoacyl-[acyl-carrier-protein] synthase family protein [Streptomyces neyagawaensis]MCL6739244.1 beta-ketoacyl-[acyl-carrier-protein] synthase family protein [Streptomyces neyagawaensis]MDE1688840.1 beta-ketoacyl-[acyl-carrier-protein] synthase family protein [Streptomyces neyagawaensis]
MSAGTVVVTGVGLVTAAGIGTEQTWRSVCSSTSTARTDPALAGAPVDISCTVPDFNPSEHVGARSTLTHDRFVQLALVAAREAVADARIVCGDYPAERVAVVVGTAFGGVSTWEHQAQRMAERGPGGVSPLFVPLLLHNMAAGQIAMDLGFTGPNLVTATACASGATALGIALDLIRQGRCDVVVAGGTEASVTPLTVTGFARMGALSRRLEDPASASRPFDAGRDGFVIAEGSGFLVLERAVDARARRVGPRAIFAGYGASADAHHMTAPDPEGRGALSALSGALADADVSAREVGYVNAHGTSTPLNDSVEAKVVAKAIGTVVPVSSSKGVTGHTLGAAGAIEAALTVLTIDKGVIPPTANLSRQDPEIELDIVHGGTRKARVDVAVSNSFGFGGQNAVLVFTSQ